MRAPLTAFASLFLISFSSIAQVKSGFFTTSDGVRLHYFEAGTGPAIVFEPGWTMPGWIWENQLRHFAAHYHVIALDPRSQGESEKRCDGSSPERRAQDIHELIARLKLSPAVLVGWSLGVGELLTYAERYGGADVRAYVLVDGFAWDKQDPEFTSAMLGIYSQIENSRRPFTEKFVRSMYKKPQSEEYLKRLVDASLQTPADSAIAISVTSIGRASWRPAVAKLDRPVLIMCETGLKSMAADFVKSMVPSARIELFGDAGHALFVDDADRFNSVLDDFLLNLH